jgi:hypothetical protein
MRWRIERRGDAVVTWSCDAHLAEECKTMQRDFEVSELVVTLAAKQAEWNELGSQLDAIAGGTA